MDNVTILVLAIVFALLVTWIIEAVRIYPIYRDDVYENLFGNFLSYFFKYAVFKDCSKSNYLKSKIGMHRMIFSAMQEDGKTKNRFCTIFYNRGIMVICQMKVNGQLLGKAKDKDWIVKRKDKDGTVHSFRHLNPSEDFKAYLRRVVAVYPQAHIEARISLDDSTDFSSVKSDIKLVHNTDIVNEMIMVQAPIISDEQIVEDYQKLVSNKR